MNTTPQTPNAAPAPTSAELGERLIRGQLTPAQYLGLSEKRLYEIATLGHHQLSEGKLQAALDIFKGLVAASPYDSVFHCNLAATYAHLERYPEALEEYSRALQLNIANLDAMVGRSEVLLNQGKLADALVDLEAALKLDPEAQRECTQRARATLAMLQAMADEAEKAQGSRP